MQENYYSRRCRWQSFLSFLSIANHMTKIRFYSLIRIPLPGLFLCLCGAISESFSAIGPADAGANLVGSTFNIQNFIPYKSQKTEAVPETNRANEFQRGTAGATESAKEGARVLAEGSDIGLGCRGWVFKSPHSDQNPSEINDFRGIFFSLSIVAQNLRALSRNY